MNSPDPLARSGINAWWDEVKAAARMRFAWRLIAAINVSVFAVLALAAGLRVGREVRNFELDMRLDHEAVAHALEPSIIAAWRRGGASEIATMIRLRGPDERLDLQWMPRTVPVALDRNSRSHDVPIFADGVSVGRLRISERRDEERSFIRTSIANSAVTSFLLAGLLSVIVGWATMLFVARPVRLFREQTRRIGKGDLTQRLGLMRRDEIGDLARDLDRMCDDLGEARLRIISEADARAHVTEQLRHADRLAAVGTLAAGVAHELGTPLGVVLARAKLIEENPALPAETQRSARSIAEQVDRMSRIIRQLLDFSRSGQGPRHAPPEATDVRAIARTVARLMEVVAEKRGIRLVVEDGGPLFALADGGRLQQVLVNLFMNAVQAMKLPGSVTVGTAVVDTLPPAGIEAPGGTYVRLDVCDQGPGIPPDLGRRIFEPFFTTKDVGEGTGLGLSVTWGIVRDLGGWIDLANIPGSGARFSVFLPAAAL